MLSANVGMLGNPTSHLQRDESAAGLARGRERYLFRQPTAADGRAVWGLIADCAPLDANSLYCNLLQCTHFADTCIVAEQDAQVRGWVSAYRPPAEPRTLFIWQVAVHPDARGCGLAGSLITALLQREALQGVRQLKATIIRDNRASWALFRSLAVSLNAPFTSQEHFESEKHFGGLHASEHMISIGPWGASDAAELRPGQSA
jgi:L-2,4-diaminobutyric acid acetyltransferase